MLIIPPRLGTLSLTLFWLIFFNHLAYTQEDSSYLDETNQEALKEMADRLEQEDHSFGYYKKSTATWDTP
jgi:hypothetical protein